MVDFKPPCFSLRVLRFLFPVFFCGVLLFGTTVLLGAQVKANVHVIIDRLPIDEQDKMRDFHNVVKNYIESVDWFEETDSDVEPIEITIQMFLKDIPSNIEDRYKCEFLISSSDVQYFDKRVRFPYQQNEVLTYNEQAIGPLTGIIDFYVNMILGSELDKYGEYGGDFYYKRAKAIAALGKFVRTEFILGWRERQELIKKVFTEPFLTFRRMKDYFFYGLYIAEDKLDEARKNLKIALDMLDEVLQKKPDFDEPKQFLDAHYTEFIDLFKDASNKNEIFKKLAAMDPDHKELYEEHIGDS